MTFTGILDTIGKDFAKGLAWAVTYAIPVEKLVGTLFPAAAPVSHRASPTRPRSSRTPCLWSSRNTPPPACKAAPARRSSPK